MIKRYSTREIFNNNLDLYKEYFKDRNVNFIKHFSTPNFTYPDAEDIGRIQYVQHVWKLGDSYSKLAQLYYNDHTTWWVIAKFNQKPTESHLSVGDIINIPVSLPVVLKYLLG